jgi:exonuclease SbcD
MRIVHTSDWHAGRIWKGVNRLDELGAVLEHLGDFAERERVDLLLHSGDVFDTGAPLAEAERLVFRFFKRLGCAGVPTVVIAGNHDSPARVEAWGALAELAEVRALARPRRAAQGGCQTIPTRCGQEARVAAVPFAAPRTFVSALELAEDDAATRQRYAEGLRLMVADVCGGFATQAVNLLMLHTHLEGALFSGSERRVHLGDEWAGTAQSLPADAHYIALGHIHKPQQLTSAPAPAHYAGSPLQLDFGEADEEKSFVLIEAEPRRPAQITRIPYQGARPLAAVRHTLPEIEREAEHLRGLGYLYVTVPVTRRDPDLAARVRALLPNAVRVQAELPAAPASEAGAAHPAHGTPPAELFAAYHQRQHGRAPEPALIEAFERLRSEEEIED